MAADCRVKFPAWLFAEGNQRGIMQRGIMSLLPPAGVVTSSLCFLAVKCAALCLCRLAGRLCPIHLAWCLPSAGCLLTPDYARMFMALVVPKLNARTSRAGFPVF